MDARTRLAVLTAAALFSATWFAGGSRLGGAGDDYFDGGPHIEGDRGNGNGGTNTCVRTELTNNCWRPAPAGAGSRWPGRVVRRAGEVRPRPGTGPLRSVSGRRP